MGALDFHPVATMQVERLDAYLKEVKREKEALVTSLSYYKVALSHVEERLEE